MNTPQHPSNTPTHFQMLMNPLLMFQGLSHNDGRVPSHVLGQPKVRRAFWRLKAATLAYVLSSMLVLVAAFLVPYGQEDGGQVGVVIRAASVVVVSVGILFLAIFSQRGSRGAYRYLRIFVCLESFGIIVVSLVIPGDPAVVHLGKLIVGVFAILTAIAAFNPKISRALAKPARVG